MSEEVVVGGAEVVLDVWLRGDCQSIEICLCDRAAADEAVESWRRWYEKSPDRRDEYALLELRGFNYRENRAFLLVPMRNVLALGILGDSVRGRSKSQDIGELEP